MPSYTYECEKHGLFDLTLPLSKWDDHKPCPKCKASSEQVLLPAGQSASFSVPIVVHVSADGKFRLPGHRDARVPKGFQVRELRNVRDVEKFERQMNAQLRSEANQHHENEERYFAQIKGQLRSELRQQMKHFSPFGRDFANLVMKLNDHRRRRPSDAGFHVEILHFDRSSREPYRDERTGWRPEHR